ncbi:hypothetical protein [Roseibium polysiphoniae]|uniref:DUF1127 domain-containing protein n=1 Tax=Roseibium polysiphoniae TaxID=2571221 RepID=A0ABR9CCZ4_9HYPH|nr:hypothetical protein [Roseibium polysiphoniae]MBD8877749.1 hypothetical protein [Roseibium polysiphoniae]
MTANRSARRGAPALPLRLLSKIWGLLRKFLGVRNSRGRINQVDPQLPTRALADIGLDRVGSGGTDLDDKWRRELQVMLARKAADEQRRKVRY